MKTVFFALVFLLFLSACTSDGGVDMVSDNLSSLLDFSFASTNISVDDPLMVVGVNSSEEVYVNYYCNVPMMLLRYDANHYVYEYPYTDDCLVADLRPFRPENISLVSLMRNNVLPPGDYMVKIHYTTVGNHDMREFKKLIFVY